ncbi:MAG TPA: oligosaccharide flippase family protein [Gaiellaceae bacterium]|jgi:O-antigen/teichoic acid export membrane protein|nr:oligosaccharide flippase family protein [Gaiellaceae bacterium]
MDSTTDSLEHATDLLNTAEAGGRVVRGAAVRAAGYGAGTLFGAVGSFFLLRHLGVSDFGRYATVTALLAIVQGISDGGLTAVGSRELALLGGEDRARLMRNLVTLRLTITPIGVLLAVGFAIVAGYDRQMVLGTLLGGIGVVFIITQTTMAMPLVVNLQLVRLTIFEVAKGALNLVAIVLLVLLGAKLLPFFAAQAVTGAALLAVAPFVVRARGSLVPGYDPALVRPLLREALPLAVALVMNVIYFRVLMIIMSLLASKHELGLFATSFQVFTVIWSLPLVVLSSALPLLAVAGRDDGDRLGRGLQSITEVGLAAGVFLTLVVYALATPAIRLLGGAQFAGAAPVLQIQAFALVPVFLGQAWQLGLLSVRRQSALIWANAIALVAVIVIGTVFVSAWSSRGAAVAAVIAESLLAALVYVFLRRARPQSTPTLGRTPRVLLAAVPAYAVLAIPAPWPVQLVLSCALFVAGCLLGRALPPELLDALRRRQSNSA